MARQWEKAKYPMVDYLSALLELSVDLASSDNISPTTAELLHTSLPYL